MYLLLMWVLSSEIYNLHPCIHRFIVIKFPISFSNKFKLLLYIEPHGNYSFHKLNTIYNQVYEFRFSNTTKTLAECEQDRWKYSYAYTCKFTCLQSFACYCFNNLYHKILNSYVILLRSHCITVMPRMNSMLPFNEDKKLECFKSSI